MVAACPDQKWSAIVQLIGSIRTAFSGVALFPSVTAWGPTSAGY